MVAAKSSRVNRQYKKKYRIRNWREYERGLRSRGDVTIWLSEDAIAAWVPPKNGLRGGQRRYSNLAVRTALTLRVVFSLPLRQTEGFLDSLLRLMGLNLKAPDHTTLSRRNQIVAVPPLTRSYDGPIDLIVASTGLKILGCGEWNAHKHKASKKRRDWRKLHIGVDAEGFIVAAELTASSRDDASTLPALLDTIEVPIRRFTSLRKKILHIPIAQSEPGIEPNGASNDFRWKAVTFEGDGVHPQRLHRNHQIEIRALNVTMPCNGCLRNASGRPCEATRGL